MLSTTQAYKTVSKTIRGVLHVGTPYGRVWKTFEDMGTDGETGDVSTGVVVIIDESSHQQTSQPSQHQRPSEQHQQPPPPPQQGERQDEPQAVASAGAHAGANASAGIPDAFLCPITLELMTDPVFALDGHTYERSAIEDWFAGGNMLSPKTGAEIGQLLVPNHAMRAQIGRL